MNVKRFALPFLVLLLLAAVGGLLIDPQRVVAAPSAVTAENLEVMLVMDSSGSMRTAIEGAKKAANEFVGAMPPNVRIGVETFGDDVTVLSQPTTDRTLLVEEINGIVADGDTALYDAVITATQNFTPAAEQKVLVLLSDGRDDGSTATLEQAITAIQGEHVEAISLTTAETDINSLSALGTVTPADDAAGVSAAFARVAALLTTIVEPTPVPPTAAPPTAPPTPAAAPTAPPTTAAAPATTVPAPPTAYTRPPAPAAATTASEGSSSSPMLWLGALGVFAGLFALGLLVFPRRRVSKARLGIQTPKRVSDMGQRTMSLFEQMARRGDLATTLSVADIGTKPAEFVALIVVIAIVTGLVGLFLGGPIIAIVVAGLVCVGTRVYVKRKKAKRLAAFADQLPDVLQLITTALRSGFGLSQAIESVAEEAEEPARSEFQHVMTETRLGRDLSEAMQSMAERMENVDLEWVVSAININRETGGNLSEILTQVSTTIRERQRMARQVRTLTAEGRLSARIITILPFGMALFQWKTNPDQFALLFSGIGLVALVTGCVLLVVGMFWVRRIVNSVAL